jgi:hypothetical protein
MPRKRATSSRKARPSARTETRQMRGGKAKVKSRKQPASGGKGKARKKTAKVSRKRSTSR